jgi:hypothetical protein
MELTEDQQKSLISILDEWVQGSRIIRNIPEQSCFVYYYEGRVNFNLKLLHEDYMLKFVFCNYRTYVNTLIEHIQPSLRKWLLKNNVEEYIFSFEFRTAGKIILKEIRVVLTSTLNDPHMKINQRKYS